MNKATVSAKKTLSIDYQLPRGISFTIHVASHGLTEVFLVDGDGRANYLVERGASNSYAHSLPARDHVIEVKGLPERALWYLLIENTEDQEIGVGYQILINSIFRGMIPR